MGSSLTAAQCFERLGVPSSDQSRFMKKVWDDLCRDCSWGTELERVPHEVSDNLRKFLNDGRLARFRRESVQGRRPQPSEDESHAWLLQLVKERMEKRKEAASQEDPAYSGSSDASPGKTKKRKRPSGKTSSTKTPNEKPAKKAHQEKNVKKTFVTPQKPKRDIRALLRSPTAQTGTESRRDVESRQAESDSVEVIHVDSDEELPSHSQIILDRSRSSDKSRAELSVGVAALEGGSASKGKSPAREPPMTPLSDAEPRRMTYGENPETVGTAQSEGPSYPSSECSDHEVTAESSHRSLTVAQQDARYLRSFRSLHELEATEDNNSQSPTTVIGLPNLSSPTHLFNQQPSIRRPITPPTTIRTNKFTDINTMGPIPFPTTVPDMTNHIPTPTHPTTDVNTAMTNNINDTLSTPSAAMSNLTPTAPHQPQTTQNERLLNLISSLTDYVRQCERHSLAVIDDPARSSHEKDTHRIRATTFLNLRTDLDSRVDAFLHDPDAEGDDGADTDPSNRRRRRRQVTSHCLWS